MTGREAMAAVGAGLARWTGEAPTAVWDRRIDSDALTEVDDALLLHVQHQALMRAYQARYVLLPGVQSGGSTVERLRRHYQADGLADLESLRRALEAELIEPALAEARAAAAGQDLGDYAARLVPELRRAPENGFIAYLRTSPDREHHYRNFLLQSSADLLAEASASALGVIGEFGAPQSALFRILIDEFGYGAHGQKHSVLYRAVMRDFGLSEEYNASWPLFDTASLTLHNTIHCLFQNPRNFFLQVGFLLFAETAYQRSTRDHFRYLSEFHPQADARYFGEHAHIDLHHARMVIDEVALPLVAAHGADVGPEIIAGAELTRRAFEIAGGEMLAVTQAFDRVAAEGRAVFAPPADMGAGTAVTPAGAARLAGRTGSIQVGGIGRITDPGAFAGFPDGAVGRFVEGEP